MTQRAAPRAGAVGSVFLAALLGGCSSLPFFGDKDRTPRPAPPRRAAGRALRARVSRRRGAAARSCSLDYLDLARFQKAPRSESDHRPRARPPRRRRAGAGARAARDRGLLRRRGEDRADAAPAAGLPHLTRHGRARAAREREERRHRCRPRRWRRRTPTRDEPWTDRLEQLRRTWSLQARPAVSPGRLEQRQERRARRAARRRLPDRDRGNRRSARIDATDERRRARGRRSTAARCSTSAPIRVEGVQRYDESAVRRLATFFARRPSTTSKLLLDYQERLRQDRPVRRRLGRARRRPARPRPRRSIVKVKELTAAPGDLRRRLQRQHRAARLGRALRPQGVRPALDRAQHARPTAPT